MSKFLNIFAPAGVGAATILTTAYFVADQFVVDMPAPVRGTFIQPATAQDDGMEAADGAVVMAAAETRDGGFGLGRGALPEEIAAWDIDIRPDGEGLPVGSGDVLTGEEIYIALCAVCHGDFGEAVGRWPVLSGGEGTLTREDPVKTVGSYWPYLSTVYDYVHRAMPFGSAQSLTDDEVYAITAYILYLNYLVEDDFVLSNENFTEVRLPNEENFFMDDRLEAEFPLFTAEPCMEDCKDSVEITMRARVLDVTPDVEEGEEEAATEEAEAETMTAEATPEEEAEVTEAAAEEAAEEAVAETAAPDPELVAAGEGVFRQCSACHQIGEDAVNRVGPHLNGIVGRQMGAIEDFRYSNVMAEAGEEGRVWSDDELAAFLADPRGAMRGTKMAYGGLRSEDDIAAMIAYLQATGG